MKIVRYLGLRKGCELGWDKDYYLSEDCGDCKIIVDPAIGLVECVCEWTQGVKYFSILSTL